MNQPIEHETLKADLLRLQEAQDAPADPNPQELARSILAAAQDGDCGAPFAPEALDALKAYRDTDLAGWMRLRADLKRARVQITELDRVMRDASDSDGPEAVSDALVALARERAEFVHDPDGEPYAVIHTDGVRQVLHIGSKAFGEWLSFAYYRDADRAPTDQSLRTALATLSGQAKFDGKEASVHLRIATTEPGVYWLDLCDSAWRCVRVDCHGWAILQGGDAPLFTRSASMRPLPEPVRGGDLSRLWTLINVPEAKRVTVLAFLVECLRPNTPHVVLELVGEQGSAKSSTHATLRRLIDPNLADLRAAPKVTEDIWIQARSSHVVSFENMSFMSWQMQDALCQLATGAGYSTRTLFTTADETVIQVKRPVILNGIAVTVTAQDLLDRSVHIELPRITSRLTSGEVEAAFSEAWPDLVGGLLDLFVKVLAALPGVEIDRSNVPRMLDFTMLGEAVARVMGHEHGTFLSGYVEMRKDGVHRTLDASPVGAALLAFLECRPAGFSGLQKDLLQELERYRPAGEPAWPKSARGLADALRRLAPALRTIDIELTEGQRTKHGQPITIRRCAGVGVDWCRSIPPASPPEKKLSGSTDLHREVL